MTYIDEAIDYINKTWPKTDKIALSLVGYLNGDTWAVLPLLVGLGKVFEVHVSSGRYSRNILLFARNEIEGANFIIDYEVADNIHPTLLPVGECKYFAPWGFPAILPGYEEYLTRTDIPILHPYSVQPAHGKPPTNILKFKTITPTQKQHIFVQATTNTLEWKSLDGIVMRMQYSLPAYSSAYPNEPVGNLLRCEETLYAKVKTCLEAKFVVTILSSFSFIAAMFQKRQIVVACVPFLRGNLEILNPNCIYLDKPTDDELQRTIEQLEHE